MSATRPLVARVRVRIRIRTRIRIRIRFWVRSGQGWVTFGCDPLRSYVNFLKTVPLWTFGQSLAVSISYVNVMVRFPISIFIFVAKRWYKFWTALN